MNFAVQLWSSFHNSLSLQCLAGAIAGFLSHTLYFIHGYHDTSILSILIFYFTAYITLIISLSLLSANLILSSYLLTLFTSITLYRIFFHPLRHFPGPHAAKITKLYGPYLVRNGQLHTEQNKLFAQYGNIIRIGSSHTILTLCCPKLRDEMLEFVQAFYRAYNGKVLAEE